MMGAVEISVGKRLASIFRYTTLAGSALMCAFWPQIGHAAAKTEQSVEPVDWCKRLTPRLPGVTLAMCRDSGLAPTGAHSIKKFPLLARHIPAAEVGASTKKPVRIMLLGGIHGDELSAAAIVFNWLQLIDKAPARQFDWQVVPVVNPDGLLAASPKRVNANGIDLNRNFPTPDWHREAARYWKKVTGSDPRRFPGIKPLSEPESLWLDREMARYQPQVIITVHAPYGVLDFDGPAEPPRRFGRLSLNQVGIYPGSLGNYSGYHKSTPVITIELPSAHKLPPKEEVQRIWQDMLAWIEQNIPQESAAVAQDNNPSPQVPAKPVEEAGIWQRLFSKFKSSTNQENTATK